MTADEHQHREVYVISDDEDDDDDDDDESVTEAGLSEDEDNERSPASVDDFSYVVVRRGSHGSHNHEQTEANGEMMHVETQCSSYPSSPPCYGDQNEIRPSRDSFDQDDRHSAADDDSYVLCNSDIVRSHTPRIDDEEETEEEDDDDEAIVKWPRRNRRSYPAIETWDAYTGRWIAQQDGLSRQGKGLPPRDVSGARRLFESSDAGSCVSLVSEESDLVATDSVIAAMCDNMEVDTEPNVFSLDRARQRMILG
ncbi:uncharacterized protein BO72DRAFT_455994 [Aspergillus fijiensis CBS 313.89]|uniref:Uncharacterized protein n=1 Tax=Aspergillus fijiensis CBS 313.89 TaxID=1448319 RepID=A0A8G1W4T2_9EURO|nr:uncharacterized protein BO72DRAFT_455994 [Aspergillus fijiensis CBS 313.89]RAK80479.1 hypothetical protein BO72DRAFT_455994 [Aspergillus fijiensis CBS 313.89]